MVNVMPTDHQCHDYFNIDHLERTDDLGKIHEAFKSDKKRKKKSGYLEEYLTQ